MLGAAVCTGGLWPDREFAADPELSASAALHHTRTKCPVGPVAATQSDTLSRISFDRNTLNCKSRKWESRLFDCDERDALNGTFLWFDLRRWEKAWQAEAQARVRRFPGVS